MKTERRHELSENVLAKEINVVSDMARQHGGTVAMVIGVGMIIYAAAAFWNSHRASVNQDAWDAYQTAIVEGDPELRSLRRVADSDEFSGTVMQEWAYLTWADRQLLLASQQYFVNRDEANKRLTDVAAVYDQYATSGVDPEIRNRSRLGLARVDEMQNRLEEARKEYNLVEGALGEYAARRATELESKQLEEDYKWLTTAPLPKPVAAAKGPGTPGLRPGFEAMPPAAEAGEQGIDSSKSLEEILGGLTEPSNDEGPRYDEGKDDATGQEGKGATTTPDATPPAATAPATPAATTPAEGAAPPAEPAADAKAPAAK